MKVKVAVIAVLVVLIGAQVYFGHRDKVRAEAARTGSTASADGSVPAGVAVQRFPEVSQVTSVRIVPPAGDPVALERTAEGWVVASHRRAAADQDLVDRLLADAAYAAASPVFLTPADLDETTTRSGEIRTLSPDTGIRLQFQAGDEPAYEMIIGLRLVGVYDKVHGLTMAGREVLFPADLRGDIGLWNNRPDERLDQTFWLDRVALSFSPDEAVRLEIFAPDHTLAFQRVDAAWQPEGYIPVEQWDADGLSAWLTDLSRFTILDLADVGEPALPTDGKAYRVDITLADGTVKTVSALRLNENGDCIAQTSDRLGAAFRLADWRFRKYFLPTSRLFPTAAPGFDIGDIRFLDIRQGGESVKISLRDGEWRGVALPYRVRPEAATRLARLLATLRPEDYAAPDYKAIRAGYGAPMVEVILAQGDVHQYRLAGRHPLFPWRYVTVDGRTILSITDEEASVLFSGFAEILDLGKVFPTFELAHLETVELRNADGALLSFGRDAESLWTASSESGTIRLGPVHGDKLMAELLDWSVAGFYDPSRLPETPDLVYYLRLLDRSGAERTVTFLPALDRDIPFLLENGRCFVIDRSDFFNWLAEAREIRKEIDNEADRLAAEQLEREILEAEQSTPEAVLPAAADSSDETDADTNERAADDADDIVPEPVVATDQEERDDGFISDDSVVLHTDSGSESIPESPTLDDGPTLPRVEPSQPEDTESVDSVETTPSSETEGSTTEQDVPAAESAEAVDLDTGAPGDLPESLPASVDEDMMDQGGSDEIAAEVDALIDDLAAEASSLDHVLVEDAVVPVYPVENGTAPMGEAMEETTIREE